MDGLLREAISLLPLIGVTAGVLAVVMVAAAFVMAESQMLDSRFGRAVFYTSVIASGIWVLVSELVPEILGALRMERFDAALALFAAVGAAGACGLVLDIVGWMRGEHRTPPPPFG